ncbi:MAG: hydroxymethylbilane synthase [Acidimicrobiales bacterium]|nr:MAG: hydroxymethylbilane synthase [Acidimicrobiales bacterium]
MHPLGSRTLRLGTRASALALQQAQLVASQLEHRCDIGVELVRVTTTGDRSSAPIAQLGEVGVFTTALRDALLAGEIDFAVHSYKDLPTDRSLQPDSPLTGLTIAAVPPREVAHDVLVSANGLGLAQLPSGARIGTGAPRRVAQLRAVRPDLRYEPLRGNVDTRLAKVFNGELDGVVLAAAALARLGRTDVVSEHLPIHIMVPAPAQGALAIECRATDTSLVQLLSTVDDRLTRATVAAEREVLARLEAGCQAPLGAYGFLDSTDEGGPMGLASRQFQLHAAVISIDGTHVLRRATYVPYHELVTNAVAVGGALAADLLAAGAATLIGTATLTGAATLTKEAL